MVYHSLMWLYQEFLEKYIIEFCRQNILQKYLLNLDAFDWPICTWMQFFRIGFRGQYFLISKIITSVCFKWGKIMIKKNVYISTYKVEQNIYVFDHFE